jgi:hypothetical protein
MLSPASQADQILDLSFSKNLRILLRKQEVHSLLHSRKSTEFWAQKTNSAEKGCALSAPKLKMNVRGRLPRLAQTATAPVSTIRPLTWTYRFVERLETRFPH